MINTLDSSGLLLGNNSLDQLKFSAKQNTPESLKLVAQQFEALFMNILTKSMRTGTGESLFDNGETHLYTELLDQQYSQKISGGKGLGLADALVQQLSRNQVNPTTTEPGLSGPLPVQSGLEPKAFSQGLPGVSRTPLPIAPKNEILIKPLTTLVAPPTSSGEFVNRFLPHAKAAGRELGVKPQAILAQAALESGWGKRQIKQEDGSPSYNLFGIKANAQWEGKVATVSTTEYVHGVAQQRVEHFRAYDSYADAFRDYAGLLKSAPRYRAVINSGETKNFAQGLQKAGYATDPNYAAKISRIAQSGSLRTLA